MSRRPSDVETLRRTRDRLTLKQRGRSRGFTLAELLVSVFVLSIIILMVAQLMNNAAAITRSGHTHISTDTQARAVFDRMAADFAQMLKRTDIDYYVKGPTNYTGHGNGHGYGRRIQTGQQGSDQIAFFSQVPGYNSTSSSWQSPLSLVAYRVNQNTTAGNPAYLKLERMGKALLWNGVDNRTNNQATYPIVFLDQTIDQIAQWSAAINNFGGGNPNTSLDPDYETIGAGVFRFEYYYLLKNGNLTDIPWDTAARPNQTKLNYPAKIGLTDVESISIAIAVIDSPGRALIDAANSNSLLDLASDMADFRTAPGRGVGGAHNLGDLEYSWQTSLLSDISAGQTSNGYALPPEAAKAIRIYGKTFDLRTF